MNGAKQSAGRNLAFCVILAIFWALPGSPRARADLRFLQPAADLGEIKAGVRLAHRFDFINDGPDRVDIVDLRPSCGCIVPALARGPFSPGRKESYGSKFAALGSLPECTTGTCK